MQLNLDYLDQWEHILADVVKTDVPLECIKKVVIKFTDELKKLLKESHNINLFLPDHVVEFLAEKGYDNKMGARPLGRKIDELIRVPLSKKILFDRLESCTINATLVNEEIVFNIELPLLGPVVNEEGYIVLDQVNPEL